MHDALRDLKPVEHWSHQVGESRICDRWRGAVPSGPRCGRGHEEQQRAAAIMHLDEEIRIFNLGACLPWVHREASFKAGLFSPMRPS